MQGFCQKNSNTVSVWQIALHGRETFMATPKVQPYQGKTVYIRLKDAPKAFSMNEDTIKKLAVKAGAMRKVSNMVLIKMEVMQAYIDSFIVYEL